MRRPNGTVTGTSRDGSSQFVLGLYKCITQDRMKKGEISNNVCEVGLTSHVTIEWNSDWQYKTRDNHAVGLLHCKLTESYIVLCLEQNDVGFQN
jgi:hypothetical protein